MLKIRYFRLRLPVSLSEFAVLASTASVEVGQGRIFVVRSNAEELILRYTQTRLISAVRILDDGSEIRTSVETMERRDVRIFSRPGGLFLSIIDPPRSVKFIEEVLEKTLAGKSYFIEALELTRAIVELHVAKFDAARLVSAKVRDFMVYDGAVGRMEITSKSGLQQAVAPFLEGKYYKIDSLTYEVTEGFTQGLVYYSSNGTIRVSGPLVDVAFPLFEASL
ncbi:hypothetical protein [Burkholderia vietnamiensis]|uniref:hypothetical protein n=1 Tax=Burkholderia vietnamiensis TaxID=60552 RepID=UPI000A6EE967|nr:hypothetical protein [Burkholderia vietnamiensis]